jgi:Fe-S-cluster containining protein
MSPGNQNPAPSESEVLDAYSRYVSGLDDFCMKLREKHSEAILCRPGCAECCSEELAVFPVEAARIRLHVNALGTARRDQIRTRLDDYRESGTTTPCPFLLQGRCLIYPARPLLCRTEGFALAYRSPRDDEWCVSICPKNFEKSGSARDIPTEDLINLESLNQSLAVLNHAYVKASGWKGEERVRLSVCSIPQ